MKIDQLIKRPHTHTKIIILVAAVGALVGSLTTLTFQYLQKPHPNDLIKEFYQVENAVHVSPHGLRKKMSTGQTDGFILVDLRSQEEYEKEHVVTAINIPAYKSPDASAYDERERIVRQFQQLPQDKEIIVYCYSMPCMTGRKVGKMLAENGIYVKHLEIGWNEWRYFWSLWNHDSETPSQVEDFIVSGKDPGTPKIQELPSPCGQGELDC